ncbi:MAG: insulinase family protein [Lentisphaeria bacterium]|nr:insulinase family protein [Lentisphaeria bacterium]
MRMHNWFWSFLAVLSLSFLVEAQQLPVDPSIKTETLDNGLKVIFKKHQVPTGKVSIWLHVHAGSLQEKDDQQGLAHFLEHLAFNGTKNFPPGELIKYFESIGLRFGQHQNAFTGFDQTTYILTLPNVQPKTIDKGVLCLSDYAFRMLLEVTEIDSEKNVILEEKRARSGVRQRLFDKTLPVILPDSLVAQRLPIGKADIVENATRSQFVDFYDTWYTPNNSTLIVVGDLEFDAVLPAIIKHFSEWKSKDVPVVSPGIKPYDKPRNKLITESEVTKADVDIVNIRPLKPENTVASFRANLIKRLTTWVFNQRMKERLEEGNASYQSAYATIYPFLNVCEYIAVGAEGKTDQIENITSELGIEMERYRLHGVLESELSRAKIATVKAAENAVDTEAGLDARSVMYRINGEVSKHLLPMSAQQKLELTQKIIPGITADELHEVFTDYFAKENRLLLVVTKPEPAIDVDKLREKLNEAEAQKPAALEDRAQVKQLISETLVPKEPIESAIDQVSGVETIEYANGIKVHLRTMNKRPNQVYMRMSRLGGVMQESENNRGLTSAALVAYNTSATSNIDPIQMRQYRTGKQFNISASSNFAQTQVSIDSSVKNFSDSLELFHALVLDAKIDKNAFDEWKKKTILSIEANAFKTDQQLFQSIDPVLTEKDPRFVALTVEQVEALKLQDAQKWLEQIHSGGPLEISLVGDMSILDMKKLTNQYIGSLPKVTKVDEKLRDSYKRFTGPLLYTKDVETETPKATLIVAWRTANYTDYKERRALQLASQILSIHLRNEIREKRGLTYSTSTFQSSELVADDLSFIGCYFTTAGDKVEEAAKITKKVFEDFIAKGPSDEEMSTVRKQFKNILDTNFEKPEYWANVLNGIRLNGASIESINMAKEQYMNIDAPFIKKTMEKFMIEANFFEIRILPVHPK